MEKLPDSIEECHKVIRLLLSHVSDSSEQIKRFEIEIRELKERLNNNSSNSSLPPSKDFKKKKKNNKPSSGKPSGGQPGHKGHYRKLLDSHEVDSAESCSLPSHCSCGGAIKENDEYMRHQV